MSELDLGSVIGPQGQRGSWINYGTAITGTDTAGKIFSDSGIAEALLNDMYLNTSTFGIYKCVTAGVVSKAKWAYIGTIKGATGNTGATGAAGQTGAKGTSMRLKGAWASGTAYANDASNIDIVTYSGSTYGCIKTHTASASITPTNTTYWLLLAAKGEKGNTGNTGATGGTGPKGDTGAKGADGVTPEFELRNGHLWVIYP